MYGNPWMQSAPYMPTFGQNQQTQSGTNVAWVYVNGIEGARAQIVQPGQTSWMMDNNSPVIYVKAVDGMGTATLKAFRLEEMGNSEPKREDEIKRLEDRIAVLEELVGGTK